MKKAIYSKCCHAPFGLVFDTQKYRFILTCAICGEEIDDVRILGPEVKYSAGDHVICRLANLSMQKELVQPNGILRFA